MYYAKAAWHWWCSRTTNSILNRWWIFVNIQILNKGIFENSYSNIFSKYLATNQPGALVTVRHSLSFSIAVEYSKYNFTIFKIFMSIYLFATWLHGSPVSTGEAAEAAATGPHQVPSLPPTHPPGPTQSSPALSKFGLSFQNQMFFGRIWENLKFSQNIPKIHLKILQYNLLDFAKFWRCGKISKQKTPLGYHPSSLPLLSKRKEKYYWEDKLKSLN